MKKVIAEHRSNMHAADSIGDEEAALGLRLQLAQLVKPKEATALLKDAVALSSKLDPATEMMVRTRLAQHYERIGNLRLAYAEAMAVAALGDEELSAQREAAGSMALEERAGARAERDSLQKVWSELLEDSKSATIEAEARSQRWMWIAMGMGVLFLFTLGMITYRSYRTNRRIGAELDALRAEVAALKEHRPTNQVRVAPPPPEVPSPEPIDEPVVPPAPAPAPIGEIDTLALAMFRKMAPERLSTLRDARARGDEAKVLRVVHSLKPQLVNFDHERFTVLCARIVSTAAQSDRAQLDADLDALEQGIDEVLRRIGH